MATTRGSDADPDAVPDAELDHVVRNLFDVELERLAFGRADTESEQRWAAAAAAELARREADAPARWGDTIENEAHLLPRARATRSASARAGIDNTRSHLERGERPWWRQSWVAVAASVLAIIAATSIAPTLTNGPIGSSSLDEFAREPTTVELDLRTQLQREGLRVSVTPRIIAARDDAQIIAYRFITTSPTERPRNEVCLLLLEEQALGAPTCSDRLDFLRDGMLATFPGQNRRYVVQWGPTGGATVSVISAEHATPEYPESPAAEAFFSAPQSESDLAYADLLRAIHPDYRLIVRVLATTPTWDAVGTLVSSAGTGLWSYCVHLFEREAEAASQLGARVTCSGREPFERDGLVAQARSADATLLIEWRPDDTVVVSEQGAP